ncbi:hypothetical protein ANOM_010186 [Aspergillus nomiae NRRL 13137]|uniref:Uncharacterized protein n=1 Tax=Aspergillus nomiae NRRL (strain ATCC 15546 / NRRL 13137 / CBS 260.88 / M93) TaxID=1509407 RepID=A0A0L1IPG7_ASPN3|nr:uncharacterized protein ANOM_010186 [Aspergillus nomiae NRRL 13137]KNG81128.1 hypothetical protein ANOM_010186 [Aspergillus nomiae NRRL 13137]
MASISTPIFCCTHISPYRPRILDQESKFNEFLEWAHWTVMSEVSSDYDTSSAAPEYAVQLVKQVNYGPLESKRYFIPRRDLSGAEFIEVGEQWLIEKNFEKLNSYKNFRCALHNKFFELNLYQKSPVNTHHWRANLARPSNEIDL